MSNSYDGFLRRINQYRIQLNLTQAETSNLIGKTQSQFSKMELGKTIISYDVLEKLLKAGWDIDYIIIGKEKIAWESSLTDYLDSNVGEAWKDLKEVLIWILGQELCKNGGFEEKDTSCEYELLKLILNRSKRNSILAEIRSMEGITQMVMAEKLGVNIKKYRDLEKGNTEPDAELLSLIYEISFCRPSLFFFSESAEKYLLNNLWNKISGEKKNEIIPFLDHAIELRKS